MVKELSPKEFEEKVLGVFGDRNSWTSPSGEIIEYEDYQRYVETYNKWIREVKENLRPHLHESPVDVFKTTLERWPSKEEMSDEEFNKVLFGDSTTWPHGEFYFLPIRILAKRRSQKLRIHRVNKDDLLSEIKVSVHQWYAFAVEGHVLDVSVYDDIGEAVQVIRNSPLEVYSFGDFPRRALEKLSIIESSLGRSILLVDVYEDGGKLNVDISEGLKLESD